MTERELFLQALDIPDPAERAAFLARACADRPDLRRALEELLQAHQQAGGFLAQPHPAAGAVEPTLSQSPPPVPSETTGTLVAGKYKLLQQIGEGGMGAVWMADQSEPVKRRVAVKLIRAEKGSSKAILSRFEAERQAIALMDHPHIARLLDAGTSESGAPFFVMELVKGVPLTEYCDARKLSIPERLKLFMQICGAVQHAHQKGIIHRDLKPTNILVESHDGRPVPKVIDFGLAKATSSLQLTEKTLFTGFGAVLGTLQYMAPEQANFNAIDIDTRADVYALGVILYELLTGVTPIARETLKQAALDEMLKLIREEEAPTPSSKLNSSDSAPSIAANRQSEPAKLGRFVKGDLDWIVMKALSKERERRYETANGFAKDIERFLVHEPVQAGPPSAAYKLRKYIRRHRGPVIAATLVLVALLAGIASTTAGLLHAEQQRRVAVKAANAERRAKQEADRQRQSAEKAAAAEKRARQEANRQRQSAEKAAAAEKLAKEQAEHRLKQTAKGVELFAGMLKGLNPRSEEEGGPPLYEQLRERASQAADELTGDSVGDPIAVALLQRLLGEALNDLGDAKKAIELLEQARATAAGQDSGLDLGPVENSLASAYQDDGQFQKAIVLQEQACERLRKTLGEEHPNTLVGLSNLGNLYRDAGKVNAAISLLERVRDAQVRLFGGDDPNAHATMNGLASAYVVGGRYLDAVALFEFVHRAFLRIHGAEHVDTLTVAGNLAVAYGNVKRHADAIALLEQVRDAKARKFGEESPTTLSTLGNLAVEYASTGNYPKAIALDEEIYERRALKLGSQHPDTLLARSNLGATYVKARDFPKAIGILEEVGPAQVAALGSEHPQTLDTWSHLADAYEEMGQFPKAIELFQTVYAGRKKVLGVSHPATLNSFRALALNNYYAQRFPDAIALNEELRDLQTAALGAKHPQTLITIFNLGCAIFASKRFEEGLALVEQAVTEMENQRIESEDFVRTVGLAAELCEQAKRLDKAVEWRRKLTAIVKQRVGPEHPQYAAVLATLARISLQLERWTDAESVLRECLAIREKAEPEDWATFNAHSMLGAALLGQKKYAEAEPLLVQGYEGLRRQEAAIPAVSIDRLGVAFVRLVECCLARGDLDAATAYAQALRPEWALGFLDDCWRSRPDGVSDKAFFALLQPALAMQNAEVDFQHAGWLAATGRTEAYQAFVRTMWERPRPSKNARVEYLLARVAGLAETTFPSAEEALRLAERVAENPLAWNLFALGMAQERSGDHAGALESFQKSQAQGWCPGLCDLGQALALQRLNREDEARAAYERGRQWCADQHIDGTSIEHPHDRIHAVLLRREMEALLSPK